MGKFPLTKTEVKKIIKLRSLGHSVNEIQKITGKGKATISRYIQGVIVKPEYSQILKAKQGGSIYRADKKWGEANIEAAKYVSQLTKRDKMLILACLYWGEGNKTEFSVINSDPYLIKTIFDCLLDLGVTKDEVKFSLRIYEDMDIQMVQKFWSKTLGVSVSKLTSYVSLKGHKLGRLKYGMCRLRIRKGERYFKLIMSMISLMRLQFNAAVVQWIEQGTPKS